MLAVSLLPCSSAAFLALRFQRCSRGHRARPLGTNPDRNAATPRCADACGRECEVTGFVTRASNLFLRLHNCPSGESTTTSVLRIDHARAPIGPCNREDLPRPLMGFQPAEFGCHRLGDSEQPAAERHWQRIIGRQGTFSARPEAGHEKTFLPGSGCADQHLVVSDVERCC